MIKIFQISALAAVLLLAGCDSPEERVQKHFARGMELLAEDQVAKARLEFRNALRLDGNHGPSRLEIARLFEADGSMNAALSNYRLASELLPDNVESRVKVAQFMLGGGDLETAKRYADEAFALAPEDPDVLATRGSLLFRAGDVDAGLELARKAIALQPGHVQATLLLIGDRVASDDPDAALAMLASLLAESESDMMLNGLKLRILEQFGRSDDLRAHLARMIELFPEEIRLRQAMAGLIYQSGDVAAAEAELRAISEENPEDDQAALRLARFILDTRGVDAAREELRSRIAARGASGTAFDLTSALVDIEYSSGRRDEAAALLREVIDGGASDETVNRARVRLAQLNFAEGDVEGARRLTDAVLASDGQNVEGLALRATLALEEDDTQTAVRDLRAALDLAPQDVRLLLLSARAHMRDGSADLAGERLAAATRQSNYAPEVSARYAAFLRGRGQGAAAATIFEEALRRSPDNAALLAALARERMALGEWRAADAAIDALASLENPAARAAAEQLRAMALAGQGQVQESLTVMRRLVDQADGETATAVTARMIAGLLNAGEVEEAAEAIAKLLAENPDDPLAHIVSAEFRLNQGDVAGASAAIDDAIAVDPASPAAHTARIRLAMAAGDMEAAENRTREAVEAVENDAAIRLVLAQLLERRGAFQEAIDVYAELYEEQPDSMIVANNLASLLADHRADDPQSIARAAAVARRLRGSDVPHFQDTYGWIAYLNGDHQEALRYLSQAAEGLPNMALVRYHAGRAFAAVGQVARARENLEAALTLDPDFPAARDAEAALAALPTDGETARQ